MSNDIEHRACLNTTPIHYWDVIDLAYGRKAISGIKALYPNGWLEKFGQRESEVSFNERVRLTGERFPIKDFILYTSKQPSSVKCPNCGMPADKIRDGHFQKIKYVYYRCNDCKKNFKITS